MAHARRALLLLRAILLLLPAGSALAMQGDTQPPRLWVYPAPGHEEYRSEHYRVRVEQGRQKRTLFCYRSRSIWHHEYPEEWTSQLFPKDNNWVCFSFSGRVVVVVEPANIQPDAVEVRPDHDGVRASLRDGRIYVEITRPGHYYLLVKSRQNPRHDFDHPLFLFANPPETDIPAKGAPGVHYFGPGVHEIGDRYPVRAGETLYIAGGALVKGSIAFEGEGVTIRGRGILTDRRRMLERVRLALSEKAAGKPDPWARNHDEMYRDKWATIYGETNAHRAQIEGITIIESPFYMVRTHGSENVFRNLKLMGDLYNNNGIVAGPDHKILDSFFKVEDDIFCWLAPRSETRNCVIWKQDNASMVMLGYGYSYATHGHTMKDIWVIMDRTIVQNMARGLFGLASSAGTMFTDCRIENLKVYGDTLCLLAIDNWYRPTPWSLKPERGMKLRPVELHFRNVEITGTERGSCWGPYVADLKDSPMRSRLRTEGEGSIRIILENVRINGRRLKSDSDWPTVC